MGDSRRQPLRCGRPARARARAPSLPLAPARAAIGGAPLLGGAGYALGVRARSRPGSRSALGAAARSPRRVPRRTPPWSGRTPRRSRRRRAPVSAAGSGVGLRDMPSAWYSSTRTRAETSAKRGSARIAHSAPSMSILTRSASAKCANTSTASTSTVPSSALVGGGMLARLRSARGRRRRLRTPRRSVQRSSRPFASIVCRWTAAFAGSASIREDRWPRGSGRAARRRRARCSLRDRPR